jgi:hypothetical protein
MKFFVFDDNEIDHGYLLQNITDLSDDEIISKVKSSFFGTFIEHRLDNKEVAAELEHNIDNRSDESISVNLGDGIVSYEDDDYEKSVEFSYYEYHE